MKKKDKIIKRIKRINNKRLFGLSILFIFIFLFSDLHTIDVKADSNYSNYLTTESINLHNDRALIIVQNSGSENNYRNYYESAFLFPNQLSENMYTTYLTTNPSTYYFSQTYLDNLDNDYAFKSVESLNQYETNAWIQNQSKINVNNGKYLECVNESYFEFYPNQDILIQWSDEGGGLPHYPKLSDGLDSTYIYTYFAQGNKVDQYGIDESSSLPSNSYVYRVQLRIRYSTNFIPSGTYVSGKVYIDGGWNSLKEFSTLTGGIKTTSINWYNTEYTNVNNLQIYLQAPSIIGLLETLNIYECSLRLFYREINKTSNYHLQNLDNNYYNYDSEIFGNTGNFPSEYSFTDDIIGSNPIGWSVLETGGTVNVIASHLNHNQVVELHDTNGANHVELFQSFSAQTYGSVEFWIASSDVTKMLDVYLTNGGSASCGLRIDADKFYARNGGAWVQIANSFDNYWSHIRFDFECSLGGYQGLNQYDYFIYINGTKYGKYDYWNNNAQINDISFESQNVDQAYYGYVDSVDYSWSDYYYYSRNYYDILYILNITSHLQINRQNHDFDNLELLELEIGLRTNITYSYFNTYLLDINNEIFDLVNISVMSNEFQEFKELIPVNYTYFTYDGKLNFTLYCYSYNKSMYSFDKINLRSVFTNYSIVDKGCHTLEILFNRQTNVGTNRGNISLHLDLYKTNFSYIYLENNVIESDYTKNGFIDFSNDLTETIQEIEIQAHIRYGLNTLDIEIVNVYYKIMINYNFTFELYEQLRKGNNDGNRFRYAFNYTSNNFIRLNNTGIFGNYSFSCLKGCRILRGVTLINYNRYFTIPFFDEKIQVTKIRSGLSGGSGGSEPDLPIGHYWEYETFKLGYGSVIPTPIGNWSIDWQEIHTELHTAKYPYYPQTFKRSDWGNWEYTNDDWHISISLNFIRNAWNDIANLMSLFLQYIGYLGTWALSYVFSYLFYSVMVMLYSYPLYYLWIGIIYALWYILEGLYVFGVWMWDLVVYVWENYLIPFAVWFNETAVPYIVEYIIIPVVAFTITLIIWILTLGNIDFWELYDVIYDNVVITSDIFIEIIQELIEHIVEVVIFIGLYFLLICMCFVKHIVVKARGFVNRALALKESYEAYIYPLEKGYVMASKIKEILANWL